MNLARRALRNAEAQRTTVTEIASDYGFWELGRFSVAYCSLFGESLSTTLHGDRVAFDWMSKWVSRVDSRFWCCQTPSSITSYRRYG
jgi:AraC-like DNA-binding protein